MVKKFSLFALLLLVLPAGLAQAPPSLFPAHEQIEALRQDPDWGGLHSQCESALTLEGKPVADFSPAPHYGPKGPRDAKDSPYGALKRESLAVYWLAQCFAISQDTRYSAKAEQLLDGWAHTTKRIGSLQGEDEFIFNFPYALMGAYLLQRHANWTDGDFSDFVRKIVVPANHAYKPNNHANWSVLLLAAAGGYLDDSSMLRQARQRWLELMRSQVAEDGSLPLEICRSDTSNWCGGPTKGIRGIAYTHYTLFPTTIAAEIFRNQGTDVYPTPEGQLLCKAYHRAAKWTLHPETFPYFASNNGKLQNINGVDYFYVLQQRCPSPEGAAVLKKLGDDAPDALGLRTLPETLRKQTGTE